MKSIAAITVFAALFGCDAAENRGANSIAPIIESGDVASAAGRLRGTAPLKSETATSDDTALKMVDRRRASYEMVSNAIRGKLLVLKDHDSGGLAEERFFCDGRWAGLSQDEFEGLEYSGTYVASYGSVCVTSAPYYASCREVRMVASDSLELGILDPIQSRIIWRQYSIRALPLKGSSQQCAQEAAKR